MGGRKEPNFKGRPPAGPGPYSRRTDMDEAQPVRAPTGLPYGERQALEAQQGAVPVPEGGPLGETGGGMPLDPAMLGAIPTARPDEDIMKGTGPAPVAPSILQLLASMPGASREVQALAAAEEVHDIPNAIQVSLGP